MVAERPLAILTGSSNPQLAHSIGEILHKEVMECTRKFADGEVRVVIPKNIRRHDVAIIQSTCPPDVNGSWMELFLMADAARKASANEITAVIPYYGYSRQDRKDQARVPISGALMAGFLREAGVNRVLTVDIHSEQLQGSFKGPWDNVYAYYSLAPKIREADLPDLVVASPDKGGFTRATAYASRLRAEGVATVFKERDTSVENHSEALDMIGNVEGKNVLIVDDILDTGGTIKNAADLLKQRGANSVRVAVTHALFSNGSARKLLDSDIAEFFITDTVPQRPEILDHPKITVVSIAPLLGEAVQKIENGESLSEALFVE